MRIGSQAIPRLRVLWPAIILISVSIGGVAGAQGRSAGAVPLYGPSGVSVQAVRQGSLGSCYFHSSIAAIAERNPNVLRSAVKDMGDGTYTVRFVDGRIETVQLDDAMFARRNKFDLSDGLWVTILLRGLAQSTMRESLLASINATALPASAKATAAGLVRSNDSLLLAYDRAVRVAVYQDGTIDRNVLKTALNHQVQALGISLFFSKPVVDFLDAQGFFEALAKHVDQNGELYGAYRAVGQGGLVAKVLAAFDAPARDLPIRSREDARTYLRRMQQSATPAVATSGATLDHAILARIRSREGGPDWWVPTHAYTVLSYDSGSDQVTLRNPWGTHPDPNGVFTVSLADFVAAYQSIDLVN